MGHRVTNTIGMLWDKMHPKVGSKMGKFFKSSQPGGDAQEYGDNGLLRSVLIQSKKHSEGGIDSEKKLRTLGTLPNYVEHQETHFIW